MNSPHATGIRDSAFEKLITDMRGVELERQKYLAKQAAAKERAKKS